MLLERNQALIGVIVAVLLVAGTAFAVGASGGMFARGTALEAEFADAAGLGTGDFVFVAGVRAGRVLDVGIDGDVARARFTLEADDIPADSRAEIIISNTLGKRAIRIVPGSSATPFADGDVITVDRTSTPIDLPELGDRSAELLGEVDVDALQGLTTALADVTEGKREDVEELIDGIDRVTAVVADRRDELATLIDSSETVVGAMADRDQELVRIIDAFGSTLDRLAERRTDIQRLLDETASTTDVAADLLEERDAQLDRVLDELHTDLAIVDAHQVDLAHTMAYLGVGVSGFASIGYQGGAAKLDNPTWGNVFVTGLGQAGVDALLGCGGTLDQLFTDLVGPDPRCDGSRPGNPPQGRTGDSDRTADAGDGASATTLTYGGLDRFFAPTVAVPGGPR